MNTNQIICPRCTSDACFETKLTDDNLLYTCYGCGFNSNNLITKKNVKTYTHVLPEIYKDLLYTDEEKRIWIPSYVNIENKGMVFVDGTGPLKWSWAAVLYIPIGQDEKSKFPKEQKYKPDMKTIKHFDEKDYMDALEYIGFFN